MARVDHIQGLQLYERESFSDHRGSFIELHRADDQRWSVPGGLLVFVEDDLSMSRRGVLRGLHGDRRTWKLMQCLTGELFLAVVDLRPDSSAFGDWFGLRLAADRPRQVLVPPGCVNGHLVLRDSALLYKQTEYYRGASAQIALRWNDPQVAIEWPLGELSELEDPPVLSRRDADNPLLADLELSGRSGNLG